MPIVFQQPGAFSGDASLGGGMAQQYSRDLPSLIRQQEQIAELYARGGQGGGGGHGGGGFLPQRPPPWEGMGGGGVGQVMQAPAMQEGPRTDPLTQAEVLRLQRLQTGMAYVDQQVTSGDLSPEEGQQFRLQLNTGIDPLRQRQQAAQTSAVQQATEQAMHQHAQLTSFQNMSAADRSSRMNQFVSPILDQDGEVLAHVITNPVDGRQTFVPQERTGRDRQEVTPQMRSQAIRHVEGQMAREEANQTTPPPWMGGDEATREQRRTQERDRRIQRHLQEITGGSARGGGTADPAALQEQQRALNAALGLNPGNDPALQRGAPQGSNPLPQSMRGPLGLPSAGILGTNSRWGPGDVFQELREAPRPDRPDAPAGVPWARVQRALNVAGQAWNNSSAYDRATHGHLKRIGRMVDLLNNVRQQGRHITRHELAHYNRLLETLSPDDRRNLAIEE